MYTMVFDLAMNQRKLCIFQETGLNWNSSCLMKEVKLNKCLTLPLLSRINISFQRALSQKRGHFERGRRPTGNGQGDVANVIKVNDMGEEMPCVITHARK